MKPISNNRVFCPSCGRPKLLFATEKKALAHIKFNNDEIVAEGGEALLRPYFCQACGGFHLTHKSHDNIDDSVYKNFIATGKYDTVEVKLQSILSTTKKRFLRVSTFDVTDVDSMTDLLDLIKKCRSGINGYIKLAEHLNSDSHKANENELRTELWSLTVQTVSNIKTEIAHLIETEDYFNASKLNKVVERLCKIMQTISNGSAEQENYITEINNGTYVTAHELKMHCKEIQNYLEETKIERQQNKMNEYLTEIRQSIHEKEYTNASKKIHFATSLARAMAKYEEHMQMLPKVIDELYEKKKFLMEVAPYTNYVNEDEQANNCLSR